MGGIQIGTFLLKKKKKDAHETNKQKKFLFTNYNVAAQKYTGKGSSSGQKNQNLRKELEVLNKMREGKYKVRVIDGKMLAAALSQENGVSLQ